MMQACVSSDYAHILNRLGHVTLETLVPMLGHVQSFPKHLLLPCLLLKSLLKCFLNKLQLCYIKQQNEMLN